MTLLKLCFVGHGDANPSPGGLSDIGWLQVASVAEQLRGAGFWSDRIYRAKESPCRDSAKVLALRFKARVEDLLKKELQKEELQASSLFNLMAGIGGFSRDKAAHNVIYVGYPRAVQSVARQLSGIETEAVPGLCYVADIQLDSLNRPIHVDGIILTPQLPEEPDHFSFLRT